MRLLDIDDIHHTFKCKFVEIETVAHIIIGRYCLGVVVYHHRAPTLFFHCLKRIHTTPVKFHRTTDAICARTEHYHALSIAFILNIILAAIVGEIEIVGHGGELACKGVDLLHHRGDSMRLAKRAHFKIRFFGISHSVFEHCTRNLEVGKAIHLCCAEKVLVESIDVALLHLFVDVDDVLQLLKEPLVYLCKLMYLVYGITLVHSL